MSEKQESSSAGTAARESQPSTLQIQGIYTSKTSPVDRNTCSNIWWKAFIELNPKTPKAIQLFIVLDLCAELSYKRHCCLWRIRSNDFQRNLRQIWHPALSFLGKERIYAGPWNSQMTPTFTDRCLPMKKMVGQSTSAMKNRRLANWAAMYSMTLSYKQPAFGMLWIWEAYPMRVRAKTVPSSVFASRDAAMLYAYLPYEKMTLYFHKSTCACQSVITETAKLHCQRCWDAVFTMHKWCFN